MTQKPAKHEQAKARTEPLDEDARERDTTMRKLIAERSDNDFIWLMNHVQGRRFMWELLGECRMFQPSFNVEALRMAHNEGARATGLKLLTRINSLCPEQYFAMQREANEQEELTND